MQRLSHLDVLVVEDDPTLRALWSQVFVDAGHGVTAVDTVEDARHHLMTTSFDLVLLDLYLGEDSGLSVATLANYSNPHCRVIVVTGSALFPRGELFDMAPAISSVLRKPVDIEELLAVSEHCVANAERISGAASAASR